jgi:acyl-CoA synthetase (AMP-forming)/AMP-acid ligase II
VLDATSLIDRLRGVCEIDPYTQDRRPLALCGTSFAFVHLLEAFERGAHADIKLELPKGSRIMETGGFKGRSREVPRDVLYAQLEQRLGIPPDAIVNQYGMTELGSQFYDSQLFEAHCMDKPGVRRKLGPPWVRVRLVDPETGDTAKPGTTGMIVIHDLANTGSIAAIQTADLGRLVPGTPDGFEVLGRATGKEERGCSIAADELWLEVQG